MGAAEERIDGCVNHCAVIRYDAYGEMSGRQSSSLALLDSHRSGVVVSSILHRESERVYVKQVIAGTGGARALARGAGGGRHRATGRADGAGTPEPVSPGPTIAFLGPAGTHSEEALARRRR